ncbi:NB-ARC domains-containing protein [Tanacetum coccineum]|uniref:NB-ARC domains-containing protein n=1 Tax=Tanacetum coccineum TaxID=301880 RepID=A0ABQ5FF31_9ASTR
MRNGQCDSALRLFETMTTRTSELFESNAVKDRFRMLCSDMPECIGKARRVFDMIPDECRNSITGGWDLCGVKSNGVMRRGCSLRRIGMVKRDEVVVNTSDFGMFIRDAHGVWLFANGNSDEARRVFDEMPVKNSVSWNAMIAGYLQCKRIDVAKEFFDRMPCKNVSSWNTMITGFAQSGFIDIARDLFDKMLRRDCISWGAIISGYAHLGHNEESLRLFVEMKRSGEKANRSIFSCILSTYEANAIFEEISDKDIVSWNTIIAGYARHGFGQEALRAFESMKKSGVKPDQVTMMPPHGALLVPAEIHCNPNSFQRWADVGGNEFEEGTTWCKESPSRLKKEGYISSPKLVLHDVEEEEKEHMLRYHSEKLAVAFGILNIQAGRPIRVFKNLRAQIQQNDDVNEKQFCRICEVKRRDFLLWSSRDTLESKFCLQIAVFTSGNSITLELKHHLGCDLEAYLESSLIFDMMGVVIRRLEWFLIEGVCSLAGTLYPCSICSKDVAAISGSGVSLKLISMEFVSAIIGPVVESLMIPVKKHLGYIFSSRNNVRNMNIRLKQLDGTSADVRKHMETNNTSHLEIPARVPGWLEEVEKIKEDAERISSNYNSIGCFSSEDDTGTKTGSNAFKTKRRLKIGMVFGWIVKVVIGQKINTFSVQQTVAEYIGQSLTETSKTARADRLRITFEKMSQEGKKVLVILDDVWEMVELNDIGLSPLLTGFKLLLTSRNETICTQIALEANSDYKVVRVDVMEESEANNFFCQITGVSEESDPVLNEIGNQIVKRCGFLPLAIKLIATTLKSQEKFVWRDTLKRLKKNDFNIPIEDLTRYAWGLKLLREIPTLGDARDRTKTCVRNLKNANLLINSDYLECVKMHDLVLAFVLGEVSKGDHPWIINHGDISRWSRAEMSRSCQKLSLTCMGMTEFPNEFKYPNLTLLRLMGGDRTLKFPEDFYEKKENLEVIAYEKMVYPLLPRSLQCSTKLRTLILHQCLLMFDCSPIGDLLTLEVLSFAHCGIRKLPSTIGNLKELKQLDLTGCVDLHIDEGVFKSLVKLEELYMRVSRGKRINFTDANFNELAQCSRNLSALEIEFFENKAQPKNMLFKKLERFRISIGSAAEMEYSEDSKSMHSFENTLNLITTKDELMESRLNELFPETEVLFLEANGMNDLIELLAASVRPTRQSFCNLRELQISKCADLRYLFAVPVASGLVKLERLTVRKCPLMEVVAYSEHGAQAVIKFQELKFLHLFDLPMLIGFCNTVSLIELPQLVELILDGLPNFTSIYPENKSSTSLSSSAIQPFLSKEVVIPKLKTLRVSKMEALQNIWPYQFCSSGEVNSCILREIEVRKCDNLVNIFPNNPITLLHHLIYLRVRDCRSLEFIFNIDVECVGEIEEGCSSLRIIDITRSGEIREVWRLKDVSNPDVIIRGFQAVERIYTVSCKSFRNLFTPTFARFDLGALERLNIDGEHYNLKSKININESVERSHEMNDINRGEILQVDIIPDVNVAIPFHVLSTFHHLRSLIISNRADVEVAFEIESATSKDLATSQRDNQQLPLFPYLEFLKLEYMKNMNYVWKCNWNKFLCSTTQQKSSFRNLKTIYLQVCNNVKYLLSPCMIRILSGLEHINIYRCDAIEEVVSNGDDEYEQVATSSQTNTTFLPRFDYLCLSYLPHLKLIDGTVKCSRVGFAFPSLCQYSRNIEINNCETLATLIPFSAVGKLQKLEELKIISCRSLREIFEIKRVNKNGSDSANVGDGIGDILPGVTIPRSANMTLLELPNLKILRIINCHLLEHIFASSTLDSLKQLIELTIEKCNAMQVIVKEDGQHASKTVFFPRLKSLTLTDLPNVEGFFFGMNEFLWSILDEVKIYGCPKMMTFTSGRSMTPKLLYIHTGIGKHSLECGLNFPLSNASHENLEKLHIRRKYPQSSYKKVNEIFEVVDLENDDVNEKQSVVVFPKLKEVTLEALDSMRYIWKSSRWITLNFPNLTKVLIDGCALLEHVFTCCMVRSLLQLHELEISRCRNMEVIVKKTEDSDTRATDVVFRSLKSIKLGSLPNLKGFCLGMEDFLWQSLDTLEIKDCPQITVFTCGQSTTPQLKVIDTSFGLCYATEDPTSFIKAKQQEGLQF